MITARRALHFLRHLYSHAQTVNAIMSDLTLLLVGALGSVVWLLFLWAVIRRLIWL